ncbi:hypothetical protein [Streptomyces sp. NPDC051211]|uniref:hypothetical protein n=1 Tax=Streptomyces sp. NPDC051211 TaxID=3154643 RepID=UPI00344D14BA
MISMRPAPRLAAVCTGAALVFTSLALIAPAAHANASHCISYLATAAPGTDTNVVNYACFAGASGDTENCVEPLIDEGVPTIVALEACVRAARP